MNKSELYDDISGIIKERVDNFEFDDHRGISIQSISPFSIYKVIMPTVIGGLKHDILIADDIKLAKMKKSELIQFDCWKEDKQPKDNHPHGWYRKFEKKRY